MGHSLTGGHSFLLPGYGMMILSVFITVKVAALSFNVGRLPSKACCRAVSEGMLLETGFGNFLLVSCQCVEAGMCVCSFSFLLM